MSVSSTNHNFSSNSIHSPKPKKIRKLFTSDEDNRLIAIMKTLPFTTWNAVSAQIPGRTARQCRDRWANYLCPTNKNAPWTDQEDLMLLEKYNLYGPQWSKIATFFDGRSDNNVKNRWNTHIKPISVFDEGSQKVVLDQDLKAHVSMSRTAKHNHPLSNTFDSFSVTRQSSAQTITHLEKITLPSIYTFQQNNNEQKIANPVLPRASPAAVSGRMRSISVQPYGVPSIMEFMNH